MRLFCAIALTAQLILPMVVFADPQTFTATHTYVLGDDDSRNSARQKCLAEAKRKIFEQVGIYLESHSELLTTAQSATRGNREPSQASHEEIQKVTEQITTLTAGIIKTDVVKEEFGELNGHLQLTLTIKMDVDSDDLQKQLAAQRADQGVRKQIVKQQQRIDELENQFRTMMKEMQILGGSERRSSDQQGKTDVPLNLVTLRELATNGNAGAQAYLGVRYATGNGLPQSDTEAVLWLRKAAEQGNALGQVGLGVMYVKGRGVPQSDTEALSWFRKAVEQGNADGQTNMGKMFALGKGVPQDDVQAVAWFRKAAEKGNSDGQAALGNVYLHGRGVPRSDMEAFSWFWKAAEQGNADAQAALGWMYFYGKGVAQNDVEALKWSCKAAEQGNAEGQSNLRKMYALGKGITQDDEQAVCTRWSIGRP